MSTAFISDGKGMCERVHVDSAAYPDVMIVDGRAFIYRDIADNGWPLYMAATAATGFVAETQREAA